MLKKILKVQGIQELSKKAQNEINGNAAVRNRSYYVQCWSYINGNAFCGVRGRQLISISSAYDSTCGFPTAKNWGILCSG